MRKQFISFPQTKRFVKYQGHWGLTPTPTCIHPCVDVMYL